MIERFAVASILSCLLYCILFVHRKISPQNFAKQTTTEMQTVSIEQQPNADQSAPNQWTYQRYICGMHRRYKVYSDTQEKLPDLLVARVLAITFWLFAIIIDLFTYSNLFGSPNLTLQFLFSAGSMILKDITSIIYASGAAAYGISFEIYFILPIVIVNCVLASVNCSINHGETLASITYIVKTILLFLAVELGYQNFKRFKFQQSYKMHHQTATRAMLRQSLYFSVTIMFFVSPVMRGIYSGLRLKCPYRNQIANGSRCIIIELDRPLFEDNDYCANDFTSMITGREHLRIIRDIVFLNIAFYSIYNKSFLDIVRTSSRIHKIILILFAAMSCSVIVANIDPFQYINIRIYFSVIEITIFTILIILLALNLQKKYEHRKHTIMEEYPTIFG